MEDSVKYRAEAEEMVASESDSSLLFLPSNQGNKCAVCDTFSIKDGGTGELKQCNRCHLVYYCSRGCQLQDWPQHKALCTDTHDAMEYPPINACLIGSVMRNKGRVLVNEHGKTLTVAAQGIEVALEYLVTTVPEPTLRVTVSSADKRYAVQVRALFSASTPTSSLSEQLADRLGMTKAGRITVRNHRGDKITAHLPSRHVEVGCIDSVGNSTTTNTIRLALLLLPNATYDLVLGRDWQDHLVRRVGRHVVLDFAPDMGRLRFLPEHRDAIDEEDLRAVAQTDVSHGSYIALPWSQPDPGPAFEGRKANDKTHDVRPDATGRYLLEAIRMAF